MEYPSALIIGLQKAIVATFDEVKWMELGYATESVDLIENDRRLLSGMHNGDEDYPVFAHGMVRTILNRKPEAIHVFRDFPGIEEWLLENNLSSVSLMLDRLADDREVELRMALVRSVPGMAELPELPPDEQERLAAALHLRSDDRERGDGTEDPRSLRIAAYVGGGEPREPKDLWELEKLDDALSSLRTERENEKRMGKNVFIVHGHDGGIKNTVARFLGKDGLGLDVTILHERASRSMTLIEKLEHYADQMDYAVVLLTPDDIGYAKDKSTEAKPRARQNVIFELGFFMAKWGRERVCAIKVGDLEGLSDFKGVVYIGWDGASGSWRNELALELKEAGLPVNAEALLRR